MIPKTHTGGFVGSIRHVFAMVSVLALSIAFVPVVGASSNGDGDAQPVLPYVRDREIVAARVFHPFFPFSSRSREEKNAESGCSRAGLLRGRFPCLSPRRGERCNDFIVNR